MQTIAPAANKPEDMTDNRNFKDEVEEGKRFKFGENWKSFLGTLDAEKITIAEESLKEMLQVNDLKGKTFLDIGCGSGLFSLAAANLGARVTSFDFDPDSVWCTQHLKNKYNPQAEWSISEGSALDTGYLQNIGSFDVVYSWGVLHHTGNMRLALSNALIPVKQEGKLFIGIYNDQKRISVLWTKVKQMYNRNIVLRYLILAIFCSYWFIRFVLVSLVLFKNPVKRFYDYKKRRGMSMFHDWIDWLGGYPFEVASPAFIIDFFLPKGFQLTKIKTQNDIGINEYVFVRKGLQY